VKPTKYIDRVDKMFKHCKDRRLSRFGPDWDAFSGGINRERQAQENESRGPERRIWQMCLVYWFEASDLLEMIHDGSSRNGLRAKALKKKKGLLNLKKKIIAGKVDAAIGTKGLIGLMARAQQA